MCWGDLDPITHICAIKHVCSAGWSHEAFHKNNHVCEGDGGCPTHLNTPQHQVRLSRGPTAFGTPESPPSSSLHDLQAFDIILSHPIDPVQNPVHDEVKETRQQLRRESETEEGEHACVTCDFALESRRMVIVHATEKR